MMFEFNLEKMRVACRSAAETLASVKNIIRPGITTDDLNRVVHNDTISRGGQPATLNYRGYPKSCCTSVNDVVCHGIPGPYVLKEGDIVNVDVTTIIDGHFGDTSATFLVGHVSEDASRLVAATWQAMMAGISKVRPGSPLNEVGKEIERLALLNGYGTVKEYGGHGIGTLFHTEPRVFHFDSGDTTVMEPGMVFTIEPMLTMGSPETVVDSADGWTVRTADGLYTAQWEHTILVTETGHEILTLI